jgi:hypothetical protein
MGRCNRKLVEKDLREPLVIVLAGVYEPRVPKGVGRKAAHQRCDFDEIRAGPGDAQDLDRHDGHDWPIQRATPAISRSGIGQQA